MKNDNQQAREAAYGPTTEKAIAEYTLPKIIEQFELVDYHDDIGHRLVNNVAFLALKRLAALTANAEPVDMLLWCPNCFEQHVDEAKPDVCETCGVEENALHEEDAGCGHFTAWLNPPHKSHRCNFCNHVWRPSDSPTNGVLKLETQGKADGFAKPSAFASRKDFDEAVEYATKGKAEPPPSDLKSILLAIVCNYPKAIKQIQKMENITAAHYSLAYGVTPALFISHGDDGVQDRVRLQEAADTTATDAHNFTHTDVCTKCGRNAYESDIDLKRCTAPDADETRTDKGDVCECGQRQTILCGTKLCQDGYYKNQSASQPAEPTRQQDDARYAKCFERIAKAIGITMPLELTAAAENDEESTAEILTRLVEQFASKAKPAAVANDAMRELTRAEVAQMMKRDAKAFHKRYAAGQRASDEDLNLMVAFGVWCYNNPLRKHSPTLESVDGRLAERPKVVCLCGSTRFTDEMLVISWDFVKRGIIVLSWNVLPSSYTKDALTESHLAEKEGVKEALDELHKRKIDLSDEVFVINLNGYIGESTRSEINYALSTNKPVRYLEPYIDQLKGETR